MIPACLSPSASSVAPPGWTAVRVETLKTLWSDGLSASQVARKLGGGATRNAVLGKIFRLGLCGRGPSAPRALPSKPSRLKLVCATMDGVAGQRPKLRAKAPRTSPKAAPARVEAAPAIEVYPDAPGLVGSCTELGAHACKWPIGDPRSASFSFCGRRAEGPYCAHHHRVAHQPRKARPLEQDRALVDLFRGSQQRRAA